MSGIGNRAHYERCFSNDSICDTSSVQILLDTETQKKSKHRKFVIGIGIIVTFFVFLLCIIFVSSKSSSHVNFVTRNNTSAVRSNSSSTQKTADNTPINKKGMIIKGYTSHNYLLRLIK